MARDKIPPGQLKKILAYNQTVKAAKEKTEAGKVLADAIAAMPPGQRKSLLTDDVKEALLVLGVEL
jgi:hypothetical protein